MHPFVDKILAPFDRALGVDIIWRPIEATLIRLARGLRRRRTRVQIERLSKELCQRPVVRQGRFAGMRYATLESTCSAILPKLLGTYEAELDAVFEGTSANLYDHIMDIGCAEGYYAVGLARRFPYCRISAFDIDPKAQDLCRQNTRLNGVADRVEVCGGVSAQDLAVAARGRRCLIICDCEGFEGSLFTTATVEAFSHSDLIIETHDFIEAGLLSRLSNLFSATHQVQLIHSIDDLQKARTYRSELADSLDYEAKELAYAESRPVIMEWLFATPHQTILR
jgi:hypothetical protein